MRVLADDRSGAIQLPMLARLLKREFDIARVTARAAAPEGLNITAAILERPVVVDMYVLSHARSGALVAR